MDDDNLIYLMRNDEVCAWYNGGQYITIDDMHGGGAALTKDEVIQLAEAILATFKEAN